MIDENLARLRTHRNNIARYRRLLKAQLTDDLEREFIQRRLTEEQSEFEALAADIFPLTFEIPAPPPEPSPAHEAAQLVGGLFPIR